jgi:hypothetical protein
MAQLLPQGQSAFGTPTALNQFRAIQNGASTNSLVNQLYAGKPANVIAASSAVKSPSIQTSTPASTSAQTSPGASGVWGSLAAGYGLGGVPQNNFETTTGQNQAAPVYPGNGSTPPPPLGSLGTTPVVKHTIEADGTQSVTHAPADNAQVANQGVDAQKNTASGTSATPVTPPVNGLNAATTGLLNTAQGNTALGQAGNAITQKYENLINPIIKGTIGQEVGDKTTGTTQVGEGNAAIASAAGGSLIQGLTNQEQQELAATGQALTGQSQKAAAQTAAGQLSTPANQFMQAPYSNQILDANGNPVGGGSAGTLPAAAQSFVNSLATQVQNGQMTRDEATSQLTAYGTAGLQALNTALGTGFNTNASNASAGTTATGQQLQTQATAANQALDTLTQQFSQLGSLTGATGFQPANSIEQSVANLFGNDAVSKYTTTLQEARAKISGVLAASGGVTPSTADEMAKTYLPDGMTPSQLPAKITAAKTLIQQSVDAFTKSGQQNAPSNSNNPTGWY